MKSFSVTIPAGPEWDACAILSESLAPLGSLAVGRTHWAAVLQSIGAPVPGYLETPGSPDLADTAEALVCAAVPDVGDPHPQRADWNGDTLGRVWFCTPGNVCVAIYRLPDGLGVSIDFGRNSRHLACEILGRMVARLPVYDLLARAALEAALDPPYALIPSAHDIAGTA